MGTIVSLGGYRRTVARSATGNTSARLVSIRSFRPGLVAPPRVAAPRHPSRTRTRLVPGWLPVVLQKSLQDLVQIWLGVRIVLAERALQKLDAQRRSMDKRSRELILRRIALDSRYRQASGLHGQAMQPRLIWRRADWHTRERFFRGQSS